METLIQALLFIAGILLVSMVFAIPLKLKHINECEAGCHPYRVVHCGESRSWCADDKVRWNRKVER